MDPNKAKMGATIARRDGIIGVVVDGAVKKAALADDAPSRVRVRLQDEGLWAPAEN